MGESSLQRGKETAPMCTVYMRIQLSDTPSELITSDVENTELAIESIVGTALLEVFDTVQVDNVTVRLTPEDSDGD
jgi:hypothetical protein